VYIRSILLKQFFVTPENKTDLSGLSGEETVLEGDAILSTGKIFAN
jgi:hypothetical protein